MNSLVALPAADPSSWFSCFATLGPALSFGVFQGAVSSRSHHARADPSSCSLLCPRSRSGSISVRGRVDRVAATGASHICRPWRRARAGARTFSVRVLDIPCSGSSLIPISSQLMIGGSAFYVCCLVLISISSRFYQVSPRFHLSFHLSPRCNTKTVSRSSFFSPKVLAAACQRASFFPYVPATCRLIDPDVATGFSPR